MNELKIPGRHAVLEAFEAGLRIKRLYLGPGTHGRAIERILKLADQQHISRTILKKADLEKLAGGPHHQGVVAVMDALPTVDLAALVPREGSPQELAIALLDGVEDPHNFGAILRVADAAGLRGVVIPRRRSASLSPGAIKASAGAAYHVPVAEVSNLARAMDELKSKGVWLVGADMAGDRLPWELDLRGPVGFVLGREGLGLHRLVREKCDYLVKLPMLGRVGSLNVSTAAAALFYERVRQLGAGETAHH